MSSVHYILINYVDILEKEARGSVVGAVSEDSFNYLPVEIYVLS